MFPEGRGNRKPPRENYTLLGAFFCGGDLMAPDDFKLKLTAILSADKERRLRP